MGCRNDYLEATGLERGLKEAAELALYAVNKLNEHVASKGGLDVLHTLPQPIFDQAANYYAKDAGQVQYLCNFIRRVMTDEQREAIVYNAHDPKARELATWWEAHKEADAARGTWVILEGPGGELDKVFFPNKDGEEPDLNVALHDALVDNLWVLNAGDSIRFVEGTAEKPDHNA